MYEELKDAFKKYIDDVKDIAGIGDYNIWLEQNRENASNKDLVIQLITTEDTTIAESWSAIKLALEKLELKNSSDLINAIERKIERDNGNLSPYDEYNACLAFRTAGGVIVPRFLEAHNHLKNMAPHLWLDLIIIAHNQDGVQLEKELIETVNQSNGVLSWKDIKIRYREILNAAGDYYGALFQNIASQLSSDSEEFLEWLDKKQKTDYTALRRIQKRVRPSRGRSIRIDVNSLRRRKRNFNALRDAA